eukprot:5107924-Alexandrium_andersonii.AAC.1
MSGPGWKGAPRRGRPALVSPPCGRGAAAPGRPESAGIAQLSTPIGGRLQPIATRGPACPLR